MGHRRSLDDLLGKDEELASFHDAALLALHVDYTQNRWIAEFDICVGDPESSDEGQPERTRRGQLTIEGLKVWVLEAPSPVPSNSKDGLWLTDYGPLNESPTEPGKTLALAIGPDAVGWWLFFTDLNTFAYLAGQTATFSWLSP